MTIQEYFNIKMVSDESDFSLHIIVGKGKINLEMINDLKVATGLNMTNEIYSVLLFENGQEYMDDLVNVYDCYKQLYSDTNFVKFLGLVANNAVNMNLEIKSEETIAEALKRWKIKHICKEDLD